MIVSYVRFQMTQLLGLVFLFLVATAFNINEGVAMTPTMVLSLLLFATAPGVIIIAVDPGDPEIMKRPPRDPKVPISNRAAIQNWVIYAVTLALAAVIPLIFGPDKPSTTEASISMTMTFIVMGLGTVLNALTNRRDPSTGLAPPILKGVGIALIPLAVLYLATSLPRLQASLQTTALSGEQWLACIGLALLLPIVVEIDKWLRRRRTAEVAVGGAPSAASVVAPARARTGGPSTPQQHQAARVPAARG